MPTLTGKVALVTGGGRRLGRAIAEALGEDGARLAVHYHRSIQGARAVSQRFGDGQVCVLQADLTDPAAAQALAGRAATHFGRLDIVINSAAVMMRHPFGSVSPEDWNAVHDLNLRAPFFVSQGAAPFLKAVGGVVVNLADVSAIDPWPSYLPHSVSKAGLQALTRGLAQVLAPEVRVNSIVPGAVLLPEGTGADGERRATERSLLGRLGDPSDVIAAVRFLVASGFVTGTSLVVDGGALARPRADG